MYVVKILTAGYAWYITSITLRFQVTPGVFHVHVKTVFVNIYIACTMTLYIP